MPASTAGLAIGAVILAVGLVLVLLPQNYSGSATLLDSPTVDDYRPIGNNSVALVTIPVVSADLSVGGASLTVSYIVQGGMAINAFLFTSTLGAEVWDGTQGTQGNITWVGGQPSGTLTDPQPVTPGGQYDAIFIVPDHGEPTISVSWSGAVQFPYAYSGIPLVIAGAIILVAVVSVLPPKANREEYPGSQAPSPEAYVYETPVVVVDSPPPALAALPSPGPQEYTSSTPPAALPSPPPAPAPPPQFAPRSSAAASTTHKPLWKATPLHRASDSEISPSHSLFRRPAVATPSPTAPGSVSAAPTPPFAAASGSSGDGENKCPRCRLAIGDANWAFCPRCRTELP